MEDNENDTEQMWEDAADDLNWERSIELKLSKHGQAIVGVGVGLGVVLVLNMMQGKVVLNLVKGHKMVVDTINLMAGSTVSSSYTKPSGYVNESEVGPVDSEELNHLTNLINKTTEVTPPNLEG